MVTLLSLMPPCFLHAAFTDVIQLTWIPGTTQVNNSSLYTHDMQDQRIAKPLLETSWQTLENHVLLEYNFYCYRV